MDSIINNIQPEIKLVLRSETIRLSAMAGYDAEEEIFGDEISWENNSNECHNTYITCTKVAIEKFCELEGIKQEFKSDLYRLISPWKKP